MPGRILIVETVASNRISLKTALTSEYFEAICISDVNRTLQSVLKYKPDIILFPTDLGSTDSYSLCKKLKLNAFSAHIPVVLYTSSADKIDWNKAVLNLVDDIQTYPSNQQQLIYRLRHLYRQKVELDALKTHANASEEFGFNDIAIDQPYIRGKKTSVAIVQHPTQKMSFNLDPSVGQSHALPNICTPSDIYENTGLIVIYSADAQCRLLSDLQEDPRTRQIPKLCLLESPAGQNVKRLYELGAEECLLSDMPDQRINMRIQSLIAMNAHKTKLRAILNDRVKEASFDPLTGIYNRRHAQMYLSKCFKASQNNNRNLITMMIDIDNFKSINDTLGHAGGDMILKEMAKRLSANLRRIDMVARVGGEEFLVIIPDASLKRAQLIAERIRRLVANKPFQLSDGEVFQKITISIGIAHKEDHHQFSSDLVHSADKALYEAKSKGRNRVFTAAA